MAAEAPFLLTINSVKISSHPLGILFNYNRLYINLQDIVDLRRPHRGGWSDWMRYRETICHNESRTASRAGGERKVAGVSHQWKK